MQHRNTYQPPNTPSFTIDSTAATATATSDSPSPNRTSHFQPLPQSRANSLIPMNHHITNTGKGGGGGGDYFDQASTTNSSSSSRSPTSTRFPPQHSNDSSSVHLPLLNDDDLTNTSSSPPPHSSSSSRTPTTSRTRSISRGGGGLSWITSLTTTRTRLHPLVLIPVFVFGVVFSMSISGNSTRDYDKMGRSAMSSLKVSILSITTVYVCVCVNY